MIFAVFAGFLPQVLTAPVTATGQDRIHQQPAALQERKCSLMDKCCPAGSHWSERSGECTQCMQGVEFTAHSNNLTSCLLCSTCYPGEEEISPCTTTKDRECQCKRGTFRDKLHPELCQQCSTRCPDGMVEAEPCTPWSDRKCVKQTPGSSQLVIGIIIGSVLVVLVLIACACACYHRRRILQGCGGDPECLNTVCFQCPRSSRKPGALDNACNEIMSNRESMSLLTSGQELRPQEHPQLAGGQSPEAEAKHLLKSAESEGSQMRSKQLAPANGIGPNESLGQRLTHDTV